MDNLIFNNDEFPTKIEQIHFAEQVWGTKFPKSYTAFLLKQNGGEVYPNMPSIPAVDNAELSWIERFCSVDDLILQKQYPMDYTYVNQHEEEDLAPFNVSPQDLLTIAIAERGCYYICLAEEQFGQIYHAFYAGGDGFIKLKTNSFDEFLNSLKPFIEEPFAGFNKTKKIYDPRYFRTPNDPSLGIKRFSEVLSFLGDANAKSTPSDWTVIQHYAYVNPYDKMGNFIFEYLLEIGGKTDGLLLRIKNIDSIVKLINEYGANFNQPYNHRYPIHLITGSSNAAQVKTNYELLDKLLTSNIEIDFSVKDSQGQTAFDALKKMVALYEKYRIKDKERHRNYPEQHQFIISDAINNLIG